MTILLVEDEKFVRLANCEFLSACGYDVHTAENIFEAKTSLKKTKPDLMVLDVLLPDGSGIDFCREIRDFVSFPILFLSCLNEKAAIVEALKTGGDDYLAKPYDMDELAARCAALLRRVKIDKENAEWLEVGVLTLDRLTQRAYLAGVDLLLKPKEFMLLLFLAGHPDHAFTAYDLYNAVWGESPHGDSRTIKAHIYQLRKKLGENSGFSIVMKDRKYYIWHVEQ